MASDGNAGSILPTGVHLSGGDTEPLTANSKLRSRVTAVDARAAEVSGGVGATMSAAETAAACKETLVKPASSTASTPSTCTGGSVEPAWLRDGRRLWHVGVCALAARLSALRWEAEEAPLRDAGPSDELRFMSFAADRPDGICNRYGPRRRDLLMADAWRAASNLILTRSHTTQSACTLLASHGVTCLNFQEDGEVSIRHRSIVHISYAHPDSVLHDAVATVVRTRGLGPNALVTVALHESHNDMSSGSEIEVPAHLLRARSQSQESSKQQLAALRAPVRHTWSTCVSSIVEACDGLWAAVTPCDGSPRPAELSAHTLEDWLLNLRWWSQQFAECVGSSNAPILSQICATAFSSAAAFRRASFSIDHSYDMLLDAADNALHLFCDSVTSLAGDLQELLHSTPEGPQRLQQAEADWFSGWSDVSSVLASLVPLVDYRSEVSLGRRKASKSRALLRSLLARGQPNGAISLSTAVWQRAGAACLVAVERSQRYAEMLVREFTGMDVRRLRASTNLLRLVTPLLQLASARERLRSPQAAIASRATSHAHAVRSHTQLTCKQRGAALWLQRAFRAAPVELSLLPPDHRAHSAVQLRAAAPGSRLIAEQVRNRGWVSGALRYCCIPWRQPPPPPACRQGANLAVETALVEVFALVFPTFANTANTRTEACCICGICASKYCKYCK